MGLFLCQTLIGRKQELNTLEKAVHDVSRGSGCCILLTGEAGIGKSRLIDELKRQAASEKFAILQGNCFEQSIAFPYAPWIDALRAYFEPLDAAEIKKRLGPLAPGVHETPSRVGSAHPTNTAFTTSRTCGGKISFV